MQLLKLQLRRFFNKNKAYQQLHPIGFIIYKTLYQFYEKVFSGSIFRYILHIRKRRVARHQHRSWLANWHQLSDRVWHARQWAVRSQLCRSLEWRLWSDISMRVLLLGETLFHSNNHC